VVPPPCSPCSVLHATLPEKAPVIGLRSSVMFVKPLNRAIVKSISDLAAAFPIYRATFPKIAPVTGLNDKLQRLCVWPVFGRFDATPDAMRSMWCLIMEIRLQVERRFREWGLRHVKPQGHIMKMHRMFMVMFRIGLFARMMIVEVAFYGFFIAIVLAQEIRKAVARRDMFAGVVKKMNPCFPLSGMP